MKNGHRGHHRGLLFLELDGPRKADGGTVKPEMGIDGGELLVFARPRGATSSAGGELHSTGISTAVYWVRCLPNVELRLSIRAAR